MHTPVAEKRRKHLRLPIEITTFIEPLSPRQGRSGLDSSLACKTLNVSRGGLQVSLTQELIVGTILQVGVDIPGADSTLMLAGEVRWCLPSNDEKRPWMAGFQLLNVDDSDIHQWAALIASMEHRVMTSSE